MSDSNQPQTTAVSSVRDYDIIIVGGGLVGATLAALIQNVRKKDRSLLNIAVVEGGCEPAAADLSKFDPRVVALTRSSQNVLKSIGAWPIIESERACPYTDMRVWDGEGTGSIHFDCLEIGESNLGHIVENSIALNAVHQRLAKATNVHRLFGERVVQLAGDEKNRRLILESSETLSAPLIIAADGARSKVRELAAIPVRQWSYGHHAIVTTVKTEQSHQFTAWQRFLSTGPLAFLPLYNSIDPSNNNVSSIVWSLNDDVAKQKMTLSDDEFNASLSRAFESRLGEVTWSDRRYCLPLWQRHAVDYTRPGLALVGDAAHSIHPLAGQGVNLGFLDAHALAGEVRRFTQAGLSLSEPSLLRRYQRNRKSHNLMTMAAMEGFKRLFGAKSLQVRWLRNAGIKQVDQWALVKNTIAREILGV